MSSRPAVAVGLVEQASRQLQGHSGVGTSPVVEQETQCVHVS